MFQGQLLVAVILRLVRALIVLPPRANLTRPDTRARNMAGADYQTALKNGIDAARSGSRMMARLHLLKAADLAPDEVAAHLWLAWVAETPADALAHLDEALARNSRHALARLGRLWTSMMAEFKATRDYADVDLGELATPSVAAPTGDPRTACAASAASTAPAASAKTIRFSTTQRMSELDEAKQHGSPSASAAALEAEAEYQGPLDLKRTVQIDLVRRERPEDADDSRASQTQLIRRPAEKEQTPTATEPAAPTSLDEPVGPATIRLDPKAVKRALAETVIAEMTSPDCSTHSPAQIVAAAEDCAYQGESQPAANSTEPRSEPNARAGDNTRPPAATADAGPRVDAYTEPPRIALSPDNLEAATASIAPSPAGPRVLVVDDSPTVRKLVSTTLESRGYRVAGVASGYEAIEVLSQTIPDALVIEVDLPRLDGLHLCKLLRTQEATRNTPVIFLTRRNGTIDRMRGKMVGATAYLTKPFRSTVLLEELAACCPVAAD